MRACTRITSVVTARSRLRMSRLTVHSLLRSSSPDCEQPRARFAHLRLREAALVDRQLHLQSVDARVGLVAEETLPAGQLVEVIDVFVVARDRVDRRQVSRLTRAHVAFGRGLRFSRDANTFGLLASAIATHSFSSTDTGIDDRQVGGDPVDLFVGLAGERRQAFRTECPDRASAWMRRTTTLSYAAVASNTSVMATRPTSKRCCTCSCWRFTAASSALVESSTAWLRSTSRYALTVRTIRFCSEAA